jgi:carbamoyl-phosphate synthase small subunit
MVSSFHLKSTLGIFSSSMSSVSKIAYSCRLFEKINISYLQSIEYSAKFISSVNKKLPITSPTIVNGNRSEGSDFFMSKKCYIHLQDGAMFEGLCPKWQSESYSGEVVFNTGMTGYVESLTDPSYTGQILIFTYPLIGNYGVQLAARESSRIQVRGVIVSEVSNMVNRSDANIALLAWLKSQNIPIVSGVDTRALTKHLRVKGTMKGVISSSISEETNSSKSVMHAITAEEPEEYQTHYKKKVILVDCGSKDNILRSLLTMPVHIKKVPYNYDYSREQYDGLLLSNGPGDPTDYPETIRIVRKALRTKKPIFGICLGNQLMGLAAGAKTYKLMYGHRGHNQPCLDDSSKRCYMTSQNHGYAIDEKTLPKNWAVSFHNLNDNSVEGIQHTSEPYFSVQFHPEACPGPTDTEWLFNKFYSLL